MGLRVGVAVAVVDTCTAGERGDESTGGVAVAGTVTGCCTVTGTGASGFFFFFSSSTTTASTTTSTFFSVVAAVTGFSSA